MCRFQCVKPLYMCFCIVVCFTALLTDLSAAAEKPLSIIFLDIDGVLIDGRDRDPLRTWIQEKLVELFGKKDARYRDYTDLERRIATSHFLSRPAIANLEKLIERVSTVRSVAIVLSSAWRLDGTLDEIKNRIFATESFSRLIIDKIPDDDWWRIRKNEKELSPIALEKYGFPLRTRGAQIDYWLRENHKEWSVDNFVIIDDVDDEISVRHSDHFVEVHKLLSESEAKKAYDILVSES